MRATIIEQPPLRLITCKSQRFPDGNREAFNAIESRLKTLNGRKFYALVYESAEGMEYFAGLLPETAEEECKFTAEGFGIREVNGGTWARVKMSNWATKTDQIGPTIGSIIAEYGYDSTRPQIEFYRSMTELHLLVPVSLADEHNRVNGEPARIP